MPTVSIGRRSNILELHVVHQPQTHMHDADRVDRDTQRLVARRIDIRRRIRADHRRAPLVQPGQTGHVPAGESRLKQRLAADLALTLAVAGPQQHGVALPHPNALALFGRFKVLREDALARFHPVDALGRRHVEQHPTSHNPVPQLGDRQVGRAAARIDQMRGLAVVHLAVPEDVAQTIEVRNRVPVIHQPEELQRPTHPRHARLGDRRR